MASQTDFLTEALGHRRSLYGLALRLTRNLGDAEDLVQETYVRAFLAWHTYRPGTHCRAWLARILLNCFISQCRREARFRRWAEGEASQGMKQDAAELTGSCPSALSDRTVWALRRLPDGFRSVVLLHDLHEKSYREIARRLGIPIGTVMSRLHRARRLLARALAPHAAEFGIRTAA